MDELAYVRGKLLEAAEQNRKLIVLVEDLQKQLNGYKGQDRREKVFSEPELAHSLSRYAKGCRCKICTKANSDYQNAYRKRHGQTF